MKITDLADPVVIQLVLYKLNRREQAAYALLLRLGRTNRGVAVDSLRTQLCMTKRTAENVLRRLQRLGLVRVEVTGTSIEVEARDPHEVIFEDAEKYIAERRRKCHALSKRESPEG